MTIEEVGEHIGEGVVYKNRYGPYEESVITAANGWFAFVRFADGTGPGVAVDPADLELLAAPAVAGTEE